MVEANLTHVDTEQANDKLINSRRAEWPFPRPLRCADLYHDAGNLGRALGREVSHAEAFDRDGAQPSAESRNHRGEETDNGRDHAESPDTHGRAVAF